MSNLHDPHVFDKEYIPLLNAAYRHMNRMDVAAEYHAYRDEARNQRAERAAMRYEILKQEARLAKWQRIEILPVPAREAA